MYYEDDRIQIHNQHLSENEINAQLDVLNKVRSFIFTTRIDLIAEICTYTKTVAASTFNYENIRCYCL
jgi:hypothetical protein